MITRRRLLQAAALSGAAATIVGGSSWAALRNRFSNTLQQPLDPKAIEQFVHPLPKLQIIEAGTDPLTIHMREFEMQVLPDGYAKTWSWGYLRDGELGDRESYIGPIIIAKRDVPTEITWVNDLGSADTTNVLAYRYGTDQTLHWADPYKEGIHSTGHTGHAPEPGSIAASNYLGPIPAVPHLHGGEVPAEIDGGPEAWFSSDGKLVGPAFYTKGGNAAEPTPSNSATYRYPNSQPATIGWFHDHTLGATRLNVYAGLAGGYLIVDEANDPENLPEMVPLVIQDRRFDDKGQLLYPSGCMLEEQWAPNPEHPYWTPEFIGDTIVVNGRTWPYLDVESRRYQFVIINGSNARGYELSIVDKASGLAGPAMWVIATEGGYLDTPVRIGGDDHETDFLLMMPGERYTVIVDFNGYAPGARDENEEDDLDPNGEIYSGTYILRNTANVPYPDGDPIDKGTTDRIMEFRVTKTATKDTSFNPAKKNAVLRGEGAKGAAIVRLAEPTTGSLVAKQHKVRQLTLNEVMGMEREAIEPSTGERAKFPGGPLEVLVNNTEWTGMRTRSATDEEIEREYRADFSLDAKNLNSLSELPYEGETEIWSFINLTADAHPIHLHLVQFQLLNRQDFDVDRYDEDYEAAFPGGGHNHMTGLPYAKGEFMPGFGPPLDYNTGTDGILGGNIDVTRIGEDGRAVYLRGDVQPPKAYEAGWKDTITCYPGQVTRIVVRFTPVEFPLQDEPYTTAFPFNPGQGYSYVWHCHIIDHEDNEMMRPFEVQPLQATRALVRGRDY